MAERNSDSVVPPSDLLKGSWVIQVIGRVMGRRKRKRRGDGGGGRGKEGGMGEDCAAGAMCCFSSSSYLRESCGFSKPESSSYWGRINHEERENKLASKSRSRRISPARTSLRRGKGVGGASVVGQLRQLKLKVAVRRDREGVRRAALTEKYWFRIGTNMKY